MDEKPLKVLVACEESGVVTASLRALGVEAYSCDLLPTSGKHPEWHLCQDVTPLLKEDWDMVIAFPPCTYLTVTGNRWFDVGKDGDKARQRLKDREFAVRFFMMFAKCSCAHVAIENPVGVMSSLYRQPDQIIEPWQFGEPYEKRTCLWLKGLPILFPTSIANTPSRSFFKSGKSMPSWYADLWRLPPDERARLRSKTFPGVAEARLPNGLLIFGILKGSINELFYLL